MVRGTNRVRIPSPHTSDIGKNLLSQILREAGIDRAVKRSREGKLHLDKISDFYSAGLTVTIHAGAEFTLEVKKVKVRVR